MNPRPEDIDALATAIDRVVFAESGAAGPDVPSAALALVSHLNDSFPRMTVASGRRDRLQRRAMRALGISASPTPPAGWVRLESEMNRRLGNLDPKWTPVVGGAALVLLGVVGFAVWRQRGAVKPAIVSAR